ncbi:MULTISPECIES: hypothetical protein [unclassified Streptomyces]|uniref:hypothetical protein n=1 Tax=unclassified Streptomyces TaxID=2593676 RepID=UPI0022583FBB|nr:MULTISPECIES: hypothetical protein [unclassified Streptomyces]MCX4988812.1 hypothetical protein [Streptomyces sp. NBC_00568]MCX5005965.1 hypothetical protein [Streptomyces sp. NBC_00638]
MPTGRPPLLLIAGLFAAGAVVTWLAATHLGYATGLAGTPGHLRVETCFWDRAGGGHRYRHCSGIFRSADGSVVDADATFDTRLPIGSSVALRRTASAGYEQPGVAASCGWLAISLLGLMVLFLGFLAARSRAGGRRTPRALLVLFGALSAAMLLSALVGGVAGMAGGL